MSLPHAWVRSDNGRVLHMVRAFDARWIDGRLVTTATIACRHDLTTFIGEGEPLDPHEFGTDDVACLRCLAVLRRDLPPCPDFEAGKYAYAEPTATEWSIGDMPAVGGYWDCVDKHPVGTRFAHLVSDGSTIGMSPAQVLRELLGEASEDDDPAPLPPPARPFEPHLELVPDPPDDDDEPDRMAWIVDDEHHRDDLPALPDGYEWLYRYAGGTEYLYAMVRSNAPIPRIVIDQADGPWTIADRKGNVLNMAHRSTVEELEVRMADLLPRIAIRPSTLKFRYPTPTPQETPMAEGLALRNRIGDWLARHAEIAHETAPGPERCLAHASEAAELMAEVCRLFDLPTTGLDTPPARTAAICSPYDLDDGPMLAPLEVMLPLSALNSQEATFGTEAEAEADDDLSRIGVVVLPADLWVHSGRPTMLHGRFQ